MRKRCHNLLKTHLEPFQMRSGYILLLIGVLFSSSRTYIHHVSTLMRLNAIKVT